LDVCGGVWHVIVEAGDWAFFLFEVVL
jgi:hypothetical protein